MLTQYPTIPVPSNAVPDTYIYSSTADQKYALGTILDLVDGRRFRYAQAGGTALAIALMCQSAATQSQWVIQIQTGKAGVIGDTDYDALITTGSTFVVNDWDGGYFVVSEGAGELGNMYGIAAHTVNDTTPTITIADPGGLRVAISATSEISIMMEPRKKVIVVPAGAGTMRPVGVPLVAIGINEYGWLQTRGPCPMTRDTTDALVLGNRAGEPATGANAGTVGLLESDGTAVPYGYVVTASSDDETAIIDLTLE